MMLFGEVLESLGSAGFLEETHHWVGVSLQQQKVTIQHPMMTKVKVSSRGIQLMGEGPPSPSPINVACDHVTCFQCAVSRNNTAELQL